MLEFYGPGEHYQRNVFGVFVLVTLSHHQFIEEDQSHVSHLPLCWSITAMLVSRFHVIHTLQC
mgnify:CR=1 FL=1